MPTTGIYTTPCLDKNIVLTKGTEISATETGF